MLDTNDYIMFSKFGSYLYTVLTEASYTLHIQTYIYYMNT